MSLILTPPPTVMVFFKEISLKNESTGYMYMYICMCVCVCVCVYVYIYIYMYVYTIVYVYYVSSKEAQ